MILPRRSFERVPPGREARSVYIFGEGSRREFDYFNYFKELDSRIKIEVYKLHPHEDNSPLGLLKIAEKNFQLMGDIPDLGCMEVYKLANSILPLIKNKLSNFIGQV